MTLDSLLNFLEAHQSLTLVILFWGAYFETLIVSSFLIYGEVFFLAGAILAGMGAANIWLVIIVLYLGGILGDHTSYWIGRKWGPSLYGNLQKRKLFRRYFTAKNYERGTSFFAKYGGWSVFIGRFLGPVSWITPFLAGIFKLSYKRFTFFDFPGVILGIGQFIILGYLFGKNYQAVTGVVQQYFLIIVFVTLIVAALLYLYRRKLRLLQMTVRQSILHYISELRTGSRKVYAQTVKVLAFALVAIVLLYVTFLFFLFFTGVQKQQQNILPDIHNSFQNVEEIVTSINSTTYYLKGTQNVGPINIIVISSSSPDSAINNAGWKPLKSIVRDQITLKKYLEQAEDKVLPVSDLYFKGVPQNLVYEFGTSTSLSTREHIRFWYYGKLHDKKVYVGSASKDIGLDLYRSKSFIVPYHAVEPNVDSSRDLFSSTLQTVGAKEAKYLSPLGPVTQSSQEDIDNLYYTNGLISVLTF